MPHIKKIAATLTHPIRQAVLRPGQPVERCAFPGDDLPTTVHYGAYTGDGLAGIISLFKSPNPVFTEDNQYQVRGMAILPEYQGKGYGDALLKEAEAYAEAHQAELIWCNARENALGFYQKAGFTITGQPFMIDGVGVHSVMYKRLK